MIHWPMIVFGPVNLWTLPPAWWFYMTPNEKAEEVDKYILQYIENDEET